MLGSVPFLLQQIAGLKSRVIQKTCSMVRGVVLVLL